MASKDDKEYHKVTRKYGYILLLVDLIVLIGQAAVGYTYGKTMVGLGAGMTIMGVLYILFPYVRSDKWSASESKSRVRTSGVICIIAGVVMMLKWLNYF